MSDLDELGPRLFRSLRRFIEREGNTARVDDLARVVRVQLLRPGVLPRMPRSRRDDLLEDVVRLAEQIHNPTDPRQVRNFVDAIVEHIRRIRPARSPRFSNTADLQAMVKDAVELESRGALSDDEIIQRAVTRAMKERKRGRGMRGVPLPKRDPLREVLQIDADQGSLAKGDVRGHLADQADTPLGEVLRDSARFAESNLRDVLGEELWGLCRPIGFADKRRRRVLVEVTSSALAQEVAMRRNELLSKLRRCRGFEKIQDVRFEVRAPAAALPVVGRDPNSR